MRTAYVNGEFLPLDQAKISILDRGFLFADGVYEVSAVIDGKLVDNAAHLARLKRSLGEIELDLPISYAELEAVMAELVACDRLDEGVVYLQVTRGAAERDFAFPENAEPTLVLFTMAKTLVDPPEARTGIKIITFEEIRWARRDIKSVAMLGQVMAKQAAVAAGAFEAWFVEDGFVTEGASSSAFIVGRDGEIVTRVADRSILPGITRKAVIALAAETGLTLVERSFSVSEAKAAAEAFITSASTLVLPVIAIDGEKVGGGTPGPMVTRLRQLYLDFARKG
ncbi:D-alanine aminotransferase [hydrothermal vent metagenome]|uniref:D-alanine aminotransferase n=1 Tax=hydrothermal vent metagenome TaxID=652676 RepID=A0A3B0TWC2_9ZZZZ